MERAVVVALRDTRLTTRRIMLGEDKNYDTLTFMNALRVRQVPQITQYMTSWLCRRSTIPVQVEETFDQLKTMGLLRTVTLRGSCISTGSLPSPRWTTT